MTVYESISLMIELSVLLIALLAYFESKHKK